MKACFHERAKEERKGSVGGDAPKSGRWRGEPAAYRLVVIALK